jgi:hypothetical protein
MSYDAIVIGARCAGSPTAMLLARKGHRVLVVDRATFPSDTVSTHILHPLGAASLARWGLLDRLTATGCPPIHTYDFDFGPSRSQARQARPTLCWRTVRGGPSWTSCSSTPRPRPAPRSVKARQSEGNGCIRADERRHDFAGGVLRARACRRDDGRELTAPLVTISGPTPRAAIAMRPVSDIRAAWRPSRLCAAHSGW